MAFTPAQDQLHSRHHSIGRPSQDQSNSHTDDGTRRSAPEEVALQLQKDGGGGSEGSVSALERDIELAFGEQEELSATSPSSPHPRRFAEPSHSQIDQDHGQGRLEELGYSSRFFSQEDKEGPLEQQEQEEGGVDEMRQEVVEEEDDDDDDDDNGEREQRGGKRQHHDEETSSGIYHSEGNERSHDTGHEDDEEPRPAKRRKLPSVSTDVALTPLLEHSPTPHLRRPRSLTPSSTAQPEMGDAQSQADHGHPPTLADDPPRVSRSPSAAVESAPVAEYQEWPFQGFLKRTRIGNETMYNLEFQLLHIPEHLHLPVLSEALGMRSNKEMSAEAATPHDAGAHSKMHSATVRPRIKRVRWTPEEDATILKMREEDGCSWEEIHAALPHRTLGAIQVCFSSKLKK